MSFNFTISGHANEENDLILYDMAIRMIRKAREIGSNVQYKGGFHSGTLDENAGVDPPDNPWVGCQNCETDGWPTPHDRNEPCPKCEAMWDPEGPQPEPGEDVSIRVPAAETKIKANAPKGG